MNTSTGSSPGLWLLASLLWSVAGCAENSGALTPPDLPSWWVQPSDQVPFEKLGDEPQAASDLRWWDPRWSYLEGELVPTVWRTCPRCDEEIDCAIPCLPIRTGDCAGAGPLADGRTAWWRGPDSWITTIATQPESALTWLEEACASPSVDPDTTSRVMLTFTAPTAGTWRFVAQQASPRVGMRFEVLMRCEAPGDERDPLTCNAGQDDAL